MGVDCPGSRSEGHLCHKHNWYPHSLTQKKLERLIAAVGCLILQPGTIRPVFTLQAVSSTCWNNMKRKQAGVQIICTQREKERQLWLLSKQKRAWRAFNSLFCFSNMNLLTVDFRMPKNNLTSWDSPQLFA